MSSPQIIETTPAVPVLDLSRLTLALLGVGVISWHAVHWRLGYCTLTGLET